MANRKRNIRDVAFPTHGCSIIKCVVCFGDFLGLGSSSLVLFAGEGRVVCYVLVLR